MNPILKKRLQQAGGAGALAIAAVLGAWFEGTGPTEKRPDGQGLYYLPYVDPVGVLTVCRGITGAQVIKGRKYTEEECTYMESKHYEGALKDARAMFPAFDSYNRWIQAALLDWIYNLGRNDATMNSTLRRKFNSGDINGGCQELTKWVMGRQKGKLVPLPGLVDRRGVETELCLNWKD